MVVPIRLAIRNEQGRVLAGVVEQGADDVQFSTCSDLTRALAQSVHGQAVPRK
ncbi:MAG: hypothetical protein K9H25_10400 [Rhodospirillum sp.]|nr:hypothetical protein [Rhodospirillum sp.]MCF8490272.1 hypothetical protein [Rhodospirillum sp.]MCF8499357.1 hypothetical protein [Rhodospirillum sp.]